jgi:hypothetical protein
VQRRRLAGADTRRIMSAWQWQNYARAADLKFLRAPVARRFAAPKR